GRRGGAGKRGKQQQGREKRAENHVILLHQNGKSSQRGGWPVASKKRSRSAGAMAVVMVLTRGWTLTGAPSLSPRSSTSLTSCSRSLIRASGVTDPGSTPR